MADDPRIQTRAVSDDLAATFAHERYPVPDAVAEIRPDDVDPGDRPVLAVRGENRPDGGDVVESCRTDGRVGGHGRDFGHAFVVARGQLPCAMLQSVQY